jgi:cytochrome d ubiquinol oxidase subunit II
MSPELLVAALVLIATIAYGIFAGADFGGGIWDALSRGKNAAEERKAIAHAMGPVWEANHVWLIFVVVLLFTGFPAAYARLSESLFIPFHLVLVGIVARGGAFVFRAHGKTGDEKRNWGALFGAASVITPVLLGMSLGAVSANLRVFAPVSIFMGLLALAICAYLAAVYLTWETKGELREAFRKKALASGTVVVALSAVTLPLLRAETPHLFAGLLSARGAPVLTLGIAWALISGAALLFRKFRLARVAAAAQVVFLLAGWGIAQYPYLIYPELTLDAAKAPASVLRFILWTAIPGLLLVVPSLIWLFRIFARSQWQPKSS